MEKRKKMGRIFASALAGAYLFALFPVISVKTVQSEAHPQEKICSFTTYFNQNEGGRCENIRLAASKLNGIALQPYGELSFNGIVGMRTKENGYKIAKIIAQGEFVDGVGGGVCQVSTTLYNAAVLSGLTVVEYHPHSMQVGYVAPSRDAMVSSVSDLKLFNPYDETVYLASVVGNGFLRFTISGKSTGKTYAIESRTIGEIQPEEPIVEVGEKEEVVRLERLGVKSESYLKTYQNGVLVSVKRLRSDEYLPQRGIVRKPANTISKK